MGLGAGLIATTISADTKASRAVLHRWVIKPLHVEQMASSAPDDGVSGV